MSSISDGIQSWLHTTANGLRGMALDERSTQIRSNNKRFLEMIKVAVLVTTAVSFLFLCAYPTPFQSGMFLLELLIARECYLFVDNALEILDKAAVEWRARLSQDRMIDQLSKGTLLVQSILRLIVS